MYKFSIQMAIYAALTLFAPTALADVDADQVRGEVLSLDPDHRSITVRITESGDSRPAAVGGVITYHIPEDANFDREATVDSVLYRSYQDPTLSQIDPGDTVLIDFEEVAARQELKKVRQEEPVRRETRDLIQRSFAIVEIDPVEPAYLADTGSRAELPKTASILPYLPFVAFGFACLALSLRLIRLRQERSVNLFVDH